MLGLKTLVDDKLEIGSTEYEYVLKSGMNGNDKQYILTIYNGYGIEIYNGHYDEIDEDSVQELVLKVLLGLIEDGSIE